MSRDIKIDFLPHAEGQCLRMEQIIPLKPKEIFPFFCDEKNLEDLTPPSLQFKVLGKTTPQIEVGTKIDYRLKLHGIPIRWRSLISEWQQNEKFVDEQLKGPYKKWHHTHSFYDHPQGTRMVDEVIFSLPLGAISMPLMGWYIRHDLRKIFSYRYQKVEEKFGRDRPV